MITNFGQGNPELTNLPRKLNIGLSPSRDDFPHTHINDVGLKAYPDPATGEVSSLQVLHIACMCPWQRSCCAHRRVKGDGGYLVRGQCVSGSKASGRRSCEDTRLSSVCAVMRAHPSTDMHDFWPTRGRRASTWSWAATSA